MSLVMAFYYMVLASGEQREPKVVLLRLEDVGPGGQYEGMDQLGKLRAVLEYLAGQGVHYQIGVVPKWLNYSSDGLSYSKSIDDPGDLYTVSLVKLLSAAEESGAVIGMHGYTHQAGEVKRADGHQESAIGNEFNVDGLPETTSLPFAEERLDKGIRIMQAAGIRPYFWETPHYHGKPEQYPVFGSRFGLIYENDPLNLKQAQPALAEGASKHSAAASRQMVYIPTPYSYIPYNKDENLILDQLGKSERLPSFFYHAFLEFKHLQPVTDQNGEQVYRDGLPEYRYPDKNKTILQKLTASIRERGYRFYSLTDLIPFTPWSRLPAGNAKVAPVLGDVTGDGQMDMVRWLDNGSVEVQPGEYRGMRNDPLPSSSKWISVPKKKGDLFGLKDVDGDGQADLWIVRSEGSLELYRSSGGQFIPNGHWQLPDYPAGSEALHLLKSRDGSVALALLSNNGTELTPFYQEEGGWHKGRSVRGRAAAFRDLQQIANPENGADQLAYSRSSGLLVRMELLPGEGDWTVSRETVNLPEAADRQLRGDFNGDGLEDILLWDNQERAVLIFLQTASGQFVPSSAPLGPWGVPGSKPVVADLDGNGKKDLLLVHPDGSMETALSFQHPDGL